MLQHDYTQKAPRNCSRRAVQQAATMQDMLCGYGAAAVLFSGCTELRDQLQQSQPMSGSWLLLPMAAQYTAV